MGSFGTVWAAEDIQHPRKLAVKEIACRSATELMNALFEKHLLGILASSNLDATHYGGAYTPPTAMASGSSANLDLSKIPHLVGHEVLGECKPKRVRLAMTRVPGIALEDFLEQRRVEAASASAAGLVVGAQRRFNEAVEYAYSLVSQLAPVFQHTSTFAIHRDVNTHNILIDAETTPGVPNFGLVDFGLAVDCKCWCSHEGDPDTHKRPTRIGQDSVMTWRYLDIAGDCRYWPVSAWTQFLIGWKEIDANPCLKSEYMLQLDQHALGITVMKVFVELLSPPPPKGDGGDNGRSSEHGASHMHGSVESSEIPHLRQEIWSLLRSWSSYWKHITPVHRKLISTFHNNGDWDVLKQMCEDTNFYRNIATDLPKMREAICQAAEACHRAASKSEQGLDDASAASDAPLFAKASRLFQALLLLISDGATPDMPNGPDAWHAVSHILRSQSGDGQSAFSDSHELPIAGVCSSQTSTAEAPPEHLRDAQAYKPAVYGMHLPS